MASELNLSEASWIWTPNFDDTLDPGRFVLFRKSVRLEALPTSPVLVRISADTRYRFFVNGKWASSGPCKSYATRWYYETVDVLPFLQIGSNVFAVKVLRFSPLHAGNSSMMRGPTPGLFVHGRQDAINLHSNSSWKAKVDESLQLIPRSEWDYTLGPPFMNMNERVDQALAEKDWELAAFNDDHWLSAVVQSTQYKMMPILPPRKLVERPIPQLPEKPRRFRSALKTDGIISLPCWNQMLLDDSPVTIPANTSLSVDIETDVLTTGYLELQCEAGSPSNILIKAAECYETPLAPPPPGTMGARRSKGNRADYHNGVLLGPVDELTTAVGHTGYQPFWFHTFRYIQLRIKTTESPLVLRSFTFRESHYPLETQTQLKLPQDSLYSGVWRLTLNTLRNCMHETYEDCPFYEQNQFAMDSRLMMLFTYQLSRDDSLARKTIHEFHASRRDDNLVEAHFPVPFRAVSIPTFSLHWILMLHDHMLYFRDVSFIRQYLGTVDGILNYFLQLRTSGRGLIGRFTDGETWPFVDWAPEWHNVSGGLQTLAVPPAYHQGEGELAYTTLLVSFVLQAAADLSAFVSRNDVAREYRSRAQALNEAVNTHCFDEARGLWTDGPGVFTRDTSQHTQVFGVLAGAATGTQAGDVMRRMLEEPQMVRCSYAQSFYLHRALALAHVYPSEFPRLLRPWETMLAQNLTTCPEDPGMMSRSDCHGWSCAPIYEAVAEIWGVRPCGAVETRQELGADREEGEDDEELQWCLAPRLDLLRRYLSSNAATAAATPTKTIKTTTNGATKSSEAQAQAQAQADPAAAVVAEGTFAIPGGTMHARITWPPTGDRDKPLMELSASVAITVKICLPGSINDDDNDDDAEQSPDRGTKREPNSSNLQQRQRAIRTVRLRGGGGGGGGGEDKPVVVQL